RAVHLSAALRAARARRAAARSRRLPADADRRAAATRAHDAPRSRDRCAAAARRVLERAERGVSPLLLPLQRNAAAGGGNLAVRFGRERRGARRSRETDPRDGTGHAVLRAADPIASQPVVVDRSSSSIESRADLYFARTFKT